MVMISTAQTPLALLRYRWSSWRRYICRNVPHGAPRNRKKFKERFSSHLSKGRKALGMVKIPFLVDPNTNVEMSESSDIVAYVGGCGCGRGGVRLQLPPLPLLVCFGF